MLKFWLNSVETQHGQGLAMRTAFTVSEGLVCLFYHLTFQRSNTMKRIHVSCIILWAFAAFSASSLFGAVPQMISYQGRLTDAVGAPINDTVDLVFLICPDSICSKEYWSESHRSVIVKEGLFAVLLGSITPIPPSVFSGSVRWLSISKDGVAANPSLRMVSAPYAFRSLMADTAYYAKSIGGTDCADCNAVFVNVAGPDSVYTTSGTAFLGKSESNTGVEVRGVEGYAADSYVGLTYGGYFSTSDVGTGVHYGVYGKGLGASASNAYGVYGFGTNTSTGNAYGGYFTVSTHGTGVHYALASKGWGNSSSGAYGIDASGVNASTGPAYGGAFTALAGGTGTHYGVYVNSVSSSTSSAYGVWSDGTSSSTGAAYGGYFRASASGTGVHYAIRGVGYGASVSDAYGSHIYAQNTSSGDVYGGYYETGVSGTGVHYGLKAESYGASASPVHGLNGRAENTSTGSVYAGLFTAASTGSGAHYGVYSQSSGTAANASYGVFGTSSSTSTGDTYGGYFSTSNNGTGTHFGVVGRGYNDDATSCHGVYGYAQNSSTGDAYGVYGYAQNTSTGRNSAGWFVAPAGGTGQKIGIYASVPGGATDWAGFFVGPVRVEGNLVVTGEKFATVQMDNGEYRGVSCQESPEVWFEDFGEGQLVNGRTHIELEPLFLQTVTISDKHPMKVFIQLNDENCKGTAVKRGATGFDVIELESGTSNASFSYRIVAKRKGYEDSRLPLSKGSNSEQMRAASEKIQTDMEKDRAKMEMENKAIDAEQTSSKKIPAELEQQ